MRRRTGRPALLWLLALATHFVRLQTAPPGISGDASRLGLYALDFLYNRLWPFYIYHQYAPHPLIVYLQALAFAVCGFSVATLRGVTAFAGALTVPALYVACGELWPGPRGRRTGLLAALGLALSPFWTQYCHNGIEGVLWPLLALLCVAWLWRGLRRAQGGWAVLAGLALGLTQYVYITARFFPVALALACGAALVAEPRRLRQWRSFALVALTAALIAVPQWILFWREPYTFWGRTTLGAAQFIFKMPDPWGLLGTKLVNQLLMLGVRWENFFYNGYLTRPLLTPVLAAGLVVALVVIARARRAPAVFLLALAGALLLPDLLTYDSPWPWPTRLIGAVPFLFALAGWGLATLWEWLERLPWLAWRTGPVLVAAVILAGGEAQWNFNAALVRLYHVEGLEWAASLVDIAEAEAILARPDEKILLPASEYQRAPLALLLADRYPRRAGGVPVPLQAGEHVTVVMPVAPTRLTTEGIPADYVPDEWVLLDQGCAYFLPPLPGSVVPLAGPEQTLMAQNGVEAARLFAARWIGGEPAPVPMNVTFENGVMLMGYEVGAPVRGQPLVITLYWRAERPVARDVEIFTMLLDAEGKYFVGVHTWPLHGVYRVRAWQPGEIVPISYLLPLPADAPAGDYQLITGLFDLTRRERYLLTTGGDFAPVTVLTLPPP